jgi:hypothetical protein
MVKKYQTLITSTLSVGDKREALANRVGTTRLRTRQFKAIY